MKDAKWFWAISWDNTVENPYVSDTADLKGFEEDDLNCGKRIEGWDPDAWVSASNPEDDGDPDDVLQTHLDLPIYSSRLRRALEKVNISGIQYLPIQVIRPDGMRIEGSSIANILNVVHALDLEKSDYDVFPDDYFLLERRGKISGIRNAVLRPSALKGYDIIRLAECLPNIHVSERFKGAFEEGQFTGYSFHEKGLLR